MGYIDMIPAEFAPAVSEIVTSTELLLKAIVGADVNIELIIPERCTVQTVQDAVCNVTGVSWGDICGQSRKRPIITARHLYCYCCKAFIPKTTCTAIAQSINRDHTTVLKSQSVASAYLSTDDVIFSPLFYKVKDRIIL